MVLTSLCLTTVSALASLIDHSINGRATTQHFASRVCNGTVAQPDLFFSIVTPASLRIVHCVEVADLQLKGGERGCKERKITCWHTTRRQYDFSTHGYVDPWIPVRPPCLQQQNGVRGVCREPICEDTSGSACTDNNVVVAANLSWYVCCCSTASRIPR